MWKERVLLAEDVQEVRAARPPTLSTGYFMYCYFFTERPSMTLQSSLSFLFVFRGDLLGKK
jgi:hypothetical protein